MEYNPSLLLFFEYPLADLHPYSNYTLIIYCSSQPIEEVLSGLYAGLQT